MAREFGEMKRRTRDEMDMILGAYRSIRHPIAYVSMPVTGGKRLYDVLERKGVKALDKLREADPDSVVSDVIKPNIERGIEVADGLRERIKLPPIAPCVFDAIRKKWSQRDYLLMWLRVIEEKAEEVYMTDDWEYSSGSAQEFARVMEMQFDFVNPDQGMEHFPEGVDLEKEYRRLRQIKVYTESGKEIRIDAGFKLVAKVIMDLHKRGFEYKDIFDSFQKLINIVATYNEPWGPLGDWERQPYTDYHYGDMTYIFKRITDIQHGKLSYKQALDEINYGERFIFEK
ncbi:MAG: hypothetical protein NTY20_04875 [Candidatus Aenigmarchaeota archaeon]|nr:hypothetical protein [Candidatus Aenigmarchaeota archaeon]